MKCRECAWFRERSPIANIRSGPYVTLDNVRMKLSKVVAIVGYCESPHLIPQAPKVLEECHVRNTNRCTRYNSLEHKESLKIMNKGW